MLGYQKKTAKILSFDRGEKEFKELDDEFTSGFNDLLHFNP
jgi:hypothetical protein